MAESTIQTRYQTLFEEARARLDAAGGPSNIRIQVGSATCEHAAGSLEVMEEFRKHIKASGRQDVILHRTGCTGLCSREPIVGVFVPGQMPVNYARVNRELVHKIFVSHLQEGTPLLDHLLDQPGEPLHRLEFLFCDSERCGLGGQPILEEAFRQKLRAAEIPESEVKVTTGTCLGAGSEEQPQSIHILVRPDRVLYRVSKVDDLDEIVASHVLQQTIVERLVVREQAVYQNFLDLYGSVAFLSSQSRVALRNAGIIDPESFDEYIRYNGFKALANILERGDPEWVVEQIAVSRLRGRGGAGFPTADKWRLMRRNPDTTRYVICNADEGDPGAFMDRSMLESDPLSVIEGMIIGGFATGACHGYVYVRAEYPLAIRRLETAVEQCRRSGVLGPNVMGSNFAFDIDICLGAGAFVCGEETALIRSIEGDRGQPLLRPPYPTDRGLWGHPTSINNVETFANVAAIINYGAEWFSRLGTERSGGTKVFALAGKVSHTGLVEVPLGTTLHQIVEGIGGGVGGGRRLKAIQTGGPSGGFIPAALADLPVDFDTLSRVGSIMGSGGMIVLSEDDCMVDLSHYYMSFICDESCGKCTPCREGSMRMLEILERIKSGQGELDDLHKLERLGRLLKRASLCGLGRSAPNPVLSGLRHFRDEFLAHVVDKRCPAKKCAALIHYEILPEVCIGCTVCARRCPANCITGKRKEAHVIDQSRCIKCGQCYAGCRFEAITRT